MNNEFVVKTPLSNVIKVSFCGIACVLAFFFFARNLYDEHLKTLLIGGTFSLLFLFLGIMLVVRSFLFMKDYIKVDANGITIDTHNRSFFPKRSHFFYKWDDMSSYTMDFDSLVGTICYDLELYDKDERIIEKIGFNELFDADHFLKLEAYIQGHLLNNPVYVFDKYGKTIFSAKSNRKNYVYGGIFCSLSFFLVILSLSAIYLGFLCILSVFFMLLGVWHFYMGMVRKNDYIIIDKKGIMVDIHTTFCHKERCLDYRSFHSYLFAYAITQFQLCLFDKDKNEVFCCDCMNLANSKYMDSILSEVTIKYEHV